MSACCGIRSNKSNRSSSSSSSSNRPAGTQACVRVLAKAANPGSQAGAMRGTTHHRANAEEADHPQVRPMAWLRCHGDGPAAAGVAGVDVRWALAGVQKQKATMCSCVAGFA